MRSDLESFDTQTRQVMADAQSLFSLLPPEQALEREREDSWSPAECLNHLTLTAQAFLPVIDRAIAAGPHSTGETYLPGRIGRWFLSQIDAPVKRTFKTTREFMPESTTFGEDSLAAAFLRAHEELLARIPPIKLLDRRKIRIKSPFAWWMTYPLGLVCYLIPAHCRRHLWQARYPKGNP